MPEQETMDRTQVPTALARPAARYIYAALPAKGFLIGPIAYPTFYPPAFFPPSAPIPAGPGLPSITLRQERALD